MQGIVLRHFIFIINQIQRPKDRLMENDIPPRGIIRDIEGKEFPQYWAVRGNKRCGQIVNINVGDQQAFYFSIKKYGLDHANNISPGIGIFINVRHNIFALDQIFQRVIIYRNGGRVICEIDSFPVGNQPVTKGVIKRVHQMVDVNIVVYEVNIISGAIKRVARVVGKSVF
ncbi:hypothetical protein D3C81_1328950 [compost metagenome]